MFKKIVLVAFGPSWKTSLLALLGSFAVAGAAYAEGRQEPGWYIVALALAAVGRIAKDADKSGTAAKPAP